MTKLSIEQVVEDRQRLSDVTQGCAHWRVDLHVHTPASRDSRWTDETTEHDIVAAFAAKEISLIAVTDHSTGSWVDRMKEAAKSYSKRNKTTFAVIPGVELNANGTHIQVIFPEDTNSNEIQLFLGSLGLKDDSTFGREDTLVTKSIPDIAEEARKYEAILIGSHCNSSKGIVKHKPGNAGLKALESLDILEISANQSPENAQKTINYVRDNLNLKDIPFVFSSDAHSQDEIVESVSVLKMATPSFTGLKQLIHEPVLRSTKPDSEGLSQTKLLGIVVKGGIYHDTVIRFNQDLNTLIGGRGSGKSALVDLLRFGLGASAVSTDIQNQSLERLVDFMDDGDEVRLYVESEGKEYCIVHTMQAERGRNKAITSSPVVYNLRDAGPLEEQQPISKLLPCEIYGQGEVLELSKKADDQMALIDSFLDLENIQSDITATHQTIKQNTEEYFNQLDIIEMLEARVKSKEVKQERIEDLKKHITSSIFSEHDVWEKEKVYIEQIGTFLSVLADGWLDVDEYPGAQPTIFTDLSESDTIKNIETLCSELHTKLKNYVVEGNTHLCEQKSIIEEQISLWNTEYARAQQELETKLQELGLQDIKNVYEERTRLSQEVAEIERNYEPALEQAQKVLNDLNIRRNNALGKLEELQKKRSEERQEIARDLNKKLNPNIKITIEVGKKNDVYFDLLLSYLKGSGVRNQEDICEKLTASFSPRELAKLVREKDETELSALGSLTTKGIETLLSLSKQQIRELEEKTLDDLPKISLKRKGETDFAPLNQLSLGEKCSAILSVLLIAEDRPLIIDEPESELDHDFICNNVVKSLRDVKGHRQVIVCTHNPNIPVLGDAELVIKVKKISGETRCQVQHVGGFEDPVSLRVLKQLEGGEEALKQRSKKYNL